METKFTFTLYTDIYHHQDLGRIRFLIQCSASRLLLLRSCKMLRIPFCVVSSLINVLNEENVFTRRVLFDSVLPSFEIASSNSFVFHILLFLFNMIFRIQLKGSLSELVWPHVLFAAFICSLVLKSRNQFLWYLKLDNLNSMLLLFPLLTFFLSSFSCLCLPFSPFPYPTPLTFTAEIL